MRRAPRRAATPGAAPQAAGSAPPTPEMSHLQGFWRLLANQKKKKNGARKTMRVELGWKVPRGAGSSGAGSRQLRPRRSPPPAPPPPRLRAPAPGTGAAAGRGQGVPRRGRGGRERSPSVPPGARRRSQVKRITDSHVARLMFKANYCTKNSDLLPKPGLPWSLGWCTL
ncbi:nucleosome-remodeling factor subunit BPTF-like [Harpia harpyja]|uniref:nucleosome-remodeling factor subunit BPTF-like n=1 Tax=Harpia harpyja TaxID=202280 RepID=UPI0022B19309|nr:nucleosome-remodeling factor subunit BPTF-like [Harpia harpyja]